MMGVGSAGCGESAEPADTTSPDTTSPDTVADTTADTSGPDGADVADTAGVDMADATSEPGDTVAPSDADTQVDAGDTVAPPNKLGAVHTFVIEPITVQSGQERQVCRTVNVPAGAALDIVRFESRMRGISHHFNLYKVIDDSAMKPVTESEYAVHDCAPAAEQLRGDAAYIYGSATPDRVMETPSGVAFHLEPGQRLILEYHAINYTTEPIVANVEIDLIAAAPEVVIEHYADIMWFANWGFALPPGKETSDTAKCSVPYDVEVFGLMSHFHELGTGFTIDAIRGGQSTQVYEDDDWKHPAYEAFMPPMLLAAGDALQWTCTWNNTRDTWTYPNKGSKDEMCMVFAAAYPKNTKSAAPIQCNLLF
jgi:hypothetical protein